MTRPDMARHTPARIEAAQRASRAVALRADGAAYAEISETVGYPSADAARKAIERAVAAARNTAVESLRATEGSRLEELWERAVEILDRDPSPAAIGAAVRVSERRAKLLGLDSPVPETGTPASTRRLDELRAEFMRLRAPKIFDPESD